MKTKKKNRLINNKLKNSNKLLCKHSIKKTYHGKLYSHPKKPLKTYMMRVSDLHTIYFATYGNQLFMYMVDLVVEQDLAWLDFLTLENIFLF